MAVEVEEELLAIDAVEGLVVVVTVLLAGFLAKDVAQKVLSRGRDLGKARWCATEEGRNPGELLFKGEGDVDIDLATILGLDFAALLRTSRRFLGVWEGRIRAIYTEPKNEWRGRGRLVWPEQADGWIRNNRAKTTTTNTKSLKRASVKKRTKSNLKMLDKQKKIGLTAKGDRLIEIRFVRQKAKAVNRRPRRHRSKDGRINNLSFIHFTAFCRIHNLFLSKFPKRNGVLIKIKISTAHFKKEERHRTPVFHQYQHPYQCLVCVGVFASARSMYDHHTCLSFSCKSRELEQR